MGGKKWSSAEEQLLLVSYPRISTKEILKLFPNRTWNALKLHAKKLKLSRLYNITRIGNLGPLLQDTREAFYWMGFIAADGYFSKSGRLRVTLSELDKEHLIKLANFIEQTNITVQRRKNKNIVSIACSDPDFSLKLRNKFGLDQVKTYQNYSYPLPINELYWAFIVGFIDGDGHIRKQSYRKDSIIVIKNHANWLEFLNHLHSCLCVACNVFNSIGAKINNRGYARLNIANSKFIMFLKEQSRDLPVLNRKWDVIK